MRVGLFTIFSQRSGGNIYKKQVIDELSRHFDVEHINLQANNIKNRYLKALRSLLNLFLFRGGKDLWIRDYYATIALNKKRTKGKNLSLVFHMDFSEYRFIAKVLLWPSQMFFYRNLAKTDGIVTISEYWKNFFLQKGYKNVFNIYCGFDLKSFDISNQEVIDFKEKHKIGKKPIVYIGNCQKAKGVVESYSALKDLPVHLVTSGQKTVTIPALNFNGNYREYLTLLKACDLAVTMSKFKEGWCMTAHEAMFLATPVIGSGKGGMKELLEGGKQLICPDFKDLRRHVEHLLANPETRKRMGQDGYDYAKNFTMGRFGQEWVDLINNL